MENKSIRDNGVTEHKGGLFGLPLVRLTMTIGYMTGIYWLSSIPGDIDPEDTGIQGIIAWTPPALQNLLHIPVFGMLAWLWYWSLSHWVRRARLLFSLSFLLAAGYGAIDEYRQLQVPGRYASLTDIALNTVGVVLVLWIISRTNRHSL